MKKFIQSFSKVLRLKLKFLEKYRYYNVAFLIVIIASVFFRFYEFPQRWGLGADDARDALIGLYALKIHHLPLMGPFSSAGPFVTGGIYYWFISLSYLILPFWIFAPWLLMEIFGILTIIVLIKIGKILGGNLLGLIIGILAATSPQLIAKSLNLGNPTFIILSSTLLILSYLLLWKTKKTLYGLICGVCLGLAVSFHYQAINLLIFFPAIFLLTSLNLKQKIIAFCLMFFGFLIPSLPLLYWDSHQGFANIRNILDYFLIGEYRIYVPNSWKIFLLQFLPTYWAFVEGSIPIFSIIIAVLSFIFLFFEAIRKKLSSSILALGIIFSLLIFINRYYHGIRSEGYFLYFTPFILILTSLFFVKLIENKNNLIKVLGLILFFVVIILNLSNLPNILSYKSQFADLEKISSKLSQKFPRQKFAIYDYKFMDAQSSLGESLLMVFQNKQAFNGVPIGFSCGGCINNYPKIASGKITVSNLNDIGKTLSNQKNGVWVKLNMENMYANQVGWLEKGNLKSTFSLENYIMNRGK